jgi:hypothetical protein
MADNAFIPKAERKFLGFSITNDEGEASLTSAEAKPRHLYEKVHRARGSAPPNEGVVATCRMCSN